MLQDIINSPFPVAILSMVVLGGALFMNYAVKPKLEEYERLKAEEDQQNKEVREALLKVAELHSLIEVTNNILDVANRATSINEHFIKIENMLNQIAAAENGIDQDSHFKLAAILEKAEIMVKIINKHPDNLEVMLSDIRRTAEDVHSDCESVLQNTSAIASHLLTTSSRMGNDKVSLTGIKK